MLTFSSVGRSASPFPTIARRLALAGALLAGIASTAQAQLLTYTMRGSFSNVGVLNTGTSPFLLTNVAYSVSGTVDRSTGTAAMPWGLSGTTFATTAPYLTLDQGGVSGALLPQASNGALWQFFTMPLGGGSEVAFFYLPNVTILGVIASGTNGFSTPGTYESRQFNNGPYLYLENTALYFVDAAVTGSLTIEAPSAPVTAVPEPSSLVLSAIGLSMMALLALRHRARA